MLTDLQKRTVQAIVNIFETGKVRGDYGQVTLLKGDSGNLTYGRSQTTLSSGNLHLLIKAYCDRPDAQFADALRPYLPRLENMDVSLNEDAVLKAHLQAAGDDQVMVDTQDAFFDRCYWEPAVKSANYIGSTTALGMAIIYDSRIHGSWHRLRDETIENFGPLGDREPQWMQAYVTRRRAWLSGHSNTLLRKTVYRMDALQSLIDEANWDLRLPISVRGQIVDQDAFERDAPVRVSAEIVEMRMLRLRQPFLQGEDIRELQVALAANNVNVDTDGIFGPATEKAVRQFQSQNGLVADGIAGPATLAALNIRI